MIYLKTNKDNIVSISRENIKSQQDEFPRYVEFVDSVIIESYDSIDTLKFKDINPIITININSTIQYRVEYKGDPDDFLKSIIRDNKLNDLLK
jgi:hypothetical protein